MANTLISSTADHVVVRKAASALAKAPGFVVAVVGIIPMFATTTAAGPNVPVLLSVIVSVVIATTAGYIYFIPSRLAAGREHPACLQILALNLFLGWTLLGWVGALVWSSGKVGKLDNRPGASGLG